MPDSVSVFAHDKVTVANIAGAAGLDITAGVGASAAITRIDNTTSAYRGGSIYTAGTDSDGFGVSVEAWLSANCRVSQCQAARAS